LHKKFISFCEGISGILGALTIAPNHQKNRECISIDKMLGDVGSDNNNDDDVVFEL
jgi:hypothetical protein